MKTITWDEIFNKLKKTHRVAVLYSDELKKMLISNNYECHYNNAHCCRYIVIYSELKYGIYGAIYDETDSYVFVKEPSVPCSNDLNDSAHLNQCCSNPNIVENIVLDKPFKVCRNCKQEVR